MAKPPEKEEEWEKFKSKPIAMEEIKVKYKDVFHLKNLYIMLHEYLYEEGWVGTPTGIKGESDYAGTAHSNIEKMYLENSARKVFILEEKRCGFGGGSKRCLNLSLIVILNIG